MDLIGPHGRAFMILASLAAPQMVFAQDDPCQLRIHGRVIDEHDRSALSFAEVFIPSIGAGDVADEEGRFEIRGLCPGTYTIRVMHLGCEPLMREVELDRDLELTFQLEHHLEELRELEVVRERPDENVGHAHERLERRDLERTPVDDLSGMLRDVPGVTLVRSGPTISKPMIHGHYGNRVLMLNQGVRQEDQQWGSEHAPNIDPYSSEAITVVKGAAAVQYGADAMGGVVILEPVALPVKEGTSGDIRSLGAFNGRGGGAGGMVQGGIPGANGLGWRMQASGKILGDQQAPGYMLSNTGLRELAASVALGLQGRRNGANLYYSVFGRELGILRAAHIGNLSDLHEAIERQRPWYVAPFSYDIAAPKQQVVHHLLKAEVRRYLTERDQLVLTYAYQANDRQEYDRRSGVDRDRPALDLFLNTHTTDLVLKHWLGTRLHGRLGASGLYQENVNLPGTGIRPLLPNYLRRTAGIFLLEHYPVNDRLELEAGARLEHAHLQVFKFDEQDQWISPTHDLTNHAFSVGANWSGTQGLRARVNLSSAFRPPHVVELYSEGLHHGAAAVEIGEPTLESERSLKAVLDLSGTMRSLEWGLTMYHDRVRDHINLLPAGTTLTIRGAFPVFRYVATTAVLNGADAFLRFAPHEHWAIRTRYSMVRGRSLELRSRLFQMPGDRWVTSISHERSKVGNWRDLGIGITATAVFQEQVAVEELDLMPPPNDHQLLGIHAGISRAIGRDELRIVIAGDNLLNVRYRDLLDRFRYFADAKGTDITLMIRYAFGATDVR